MSGQSEMRIIYRSYGIRCSDNFMLQIKRNQFALLSQAATTRFYTSLNKYLENNFSDYAELQRLDLDAKCRKSCEELKITTEEGIYAFYVLSFMLGETLQPNQDYLFTHKRYILLGHDADQLPIDLLSELEK
jgi:hypothetical protein